MRKIIALFFISFFLISCSRVYQEHFFQEQISHTGSSGFESLTFSGHIYSQPDKRTLPHIISLIEQSQKRIWIEVYTWTNIQELTDAIIAAHARGVDVRVVLEGNVYQTPTINTPIARILEREGIPYVFADNYRYTFTHAKFWIIDDRYFISTGNWTRSLFSKNQEYIYTNTDTETLDFLSSVFEADEAHLSYRDPSRIPQHMVISPLNSRDRIRELIRSTQTRIILYVQTLSDPATIELLQTLQSQGKSVSICTADNESGKDPKPDNLASHWFIQQKPYLHAKLILVDDTTVFLGSLNLTTNAIDHNREIGVLLQVPRDMIQTMRETIQKNCIPNLETVVKIK